MERISTNIASTHPTLKQKVESDEFYIKAGLKGRSYHDEIISLGREPRRRTLKAWWRGRGTFQKDQPMIVCLHQRKGSIAEFFVPQTKRQPLLGTLKEHIEPKTMIYTDDFRPYKSLPIAIMDTHEFVNHSEVEYARGDVHINNCECRTAKSLQALDEEVYGSE